MGADYTFECVGSGAALNTALGVTRPGGTVCLSGVIPHAIEFNWNDVLRDEKAITTTNAYNDEFPIVIAMMNDGRLRAEPLVSVGKARVGLPEKCLALRSERSMHAFDNRIHGF
jgi:threonine dehydrogenase-like Zn-dependent dehydrogenase